MLRNWFSGSRADARTSVIDWDCEDEALHFRPSAPEASLVDWLSAPPETAEPLTADRCRILGQWLVDGLAEMEGNGVRVNLAAFFLADELDRRALKLAEGAPFRYRLDAKGTLHDPSVKLAIQALDASGRPVAGLIRQGCLLDDGIARYLLSEPEYQLWREVEFFNARPDDERHHDAQLRRYASIRELAERLSVQLDTYLGRETALVVGEIGIELVNHGPDELEVRPALVGAEGEAVARSLDSHRAVPEILTLQGASGARERLVLNPEIREGLAQVKRVRRLHGKARRDFLARPQDFLDATKVNLEDFGARVMGIGLYTVRYYPLITNRERSWLPEAISLIIASDDPAIEPVQIDFASLEEFTPLETAYQKAVTAGEPSISWGAHALPIDGDTERTLGAIREALVIREEADQVAAETHATEPAIEEATEAEQSAPEHYVLLIGANEDETEYVEKAPEAIAPKHPLRRPRALLPHVNLLPHQARGVAWIQARFDAGARGILLADDMGLGKTLQVLTFLAWYRETARTPLPILVVAPVALLENWRDEYYKFLEPIFGPPLELHGQGIARFKITPGGGREYHHEGGRRLLDTEAIANHGLVLTTYEAVRDYQFSLASIHWGIVVTDEAQKIKSPGALMTNAAKALKTDFRIAATGTPVENSMDDLWCLMDFAQPGLLGSLREFRASYVADGNDSAGFEAKGQQLRSRIDDSFIRRLKVEILKDLPARLEHEVAIPMDAAQARRYLEETASFRSGKSGPSHILTLLRRLKNLSCHPSLLDEDEPRANLRDLAKEAPKLRWVVEKLTEIKRMEEKVVLFAEERRTQRLLAQIVHGVVGFSPAIVNGEVPGISSTGASRKGLIDAFQARPGFNVIILSPLAVGFGFTITAANHVIHVTRLWNPAKEDQATDRVHRIGQTKDVHIYYPKAVDPHGRFSSFDDVLASLLAKKRALASNVLYPSTNLAINEAELAQLLLAQP